MAAVKAQAQRARSNIYSYPPSPTCYMFLTGGDEFLEEGGADLSELPEEGGEGAEAGEQLGELQPGNMVLASHNNQFTQGIEKFSLRLTSFSTRCLNDHFKRTLPFMPVVK